MNPGWLFENNVYCVKCNNFNTAVAASDRLPASGSFIDMAGYDHGVFLIGVGTEDTAATFAVYQDTSATETASIKAVTSASQLVAATDDNKWLTIEFNASQLDQDNSFRYVTLVPDAGTGSNDYYCVFFLGFGARDLPVTQPSNYAYHVSVVS
jgi:hypothetical protein